MTKVSTLEKKNKQKGHLKDIVDFSLTFVFENNRLPLQDTFKNVGYDFTVCFRHKNWRGEKKRCIGRLVKMV